MDEKERLDYLAKIASQFYERGVSVEEIAEGAGLPVSEVNALLSEARDKGVVEFVVHYPWKTSPDLEQQLKQRFNLKGTRVLIRENKSYPELLQGLGKLAADYLVSILSDKTVIGISWGSALQQMIRSLPPMSLPDVEVVQLIGATGSESNPDDGPILARLLSNRLGASCRYLHAPLIVKNETGRNVLLQERTIRETLARAENANIAMVGIGSTDAQFSSLLRTGYLSKDEVEQIRTAGAVGDICAQHYTASGEWLNIDVNRRVVGISLDTLSRIPTVIAVSGGVHKSVSILAALKKQYVNVLITDDQTALKLLELADAQSPAAGLSPAVEPDAPVEPLISLKGIWKVFNGVAVLRGVNLDLKPGEIHALLGGNGSGKSTLMKILSGVYQLDAGAVEMEGKPITIKGPAHGHELGIYMVPQEPQIFPHLSIEENLMMGLDLPLVEARERIRELAGELGFNSNLGEDAGTLSIANQQLLEIIRGLLRNAKVLVFDEPTSSLTFREVDSLFAILHKLTARRIGIFFISHRLNEILSIADRISVLCDGRLVLSERAGSLTTHDLIRAMLPESAEADNGASTSYQPHEPGEVVLEIKNLEGQLFHKVNLVVRAGEVVGLAGVVGAGRTELALGILGIDKDVHGEVWIGGKLVANRSPKACQDLGLMYVPEDRHAHGIFPELPNYLTTTASILPRLGRFILSFKEEYHLAEKYSKQLQIKATSLFQPSSTLSGGNQQKVVLSKSLACRPRVIILDEPTRGVDAKARQDVYHLVRQLTSQQVGVLLISSDLEEVTQLSDRVLVMYHGGILEELPRPDCQIGRITAAAFGMRGNV